MNHELSPSFIASHVDGRGSVWKCLAHRKQKAEKTFPDREELGCCPKNFWDALDWLSTRWEISIMEMERLLLFSFFGLSFYWCGTREKFMHRPWGKKEIHSERPNSCLKAKEHLVSVPWSSSMQAKCRTMSSQSHKAISSALAQHSMAQGLFYFFFFYRKFTYWMVW